MRLACLAPFLLLVACGDDSGAPPDAESVGDCGCVPLDAPALDAEVPDSIPPDAQWSLPDPDLTGTALVAVHPPVAEDLLVYFAATYTMSAGPDGTARLEAALQPLSYQTLQPVGGAFTDTTIVVDAHDGFALDLEGMLPAEANPITGQRVELDATLHATVRTADFACGTIIGTAGTLPLAGSTFGSVRIPDEMTMPAPVSACPAD